MTERATHPRLPGSLIDSSVQLADRAENWPVRVALAGKIADAMAVAGVLAASASRGRA